MGPYDPILSGSLNLYNVTLAMLALVGAAIVATQVMHAARYPTPIVRGWRRVSSIVALTLIVLGIITFGMLVTAGPNGDVPPWGVSYALPAVFLGLVAVLTVLRPVEASRDLITAAAVAFLAAIALGLIAVQIDPRWARDEIEVGMTAATMLIFCAPATLTAMLLLLASLPTQGGDEARPPA